MNEVIDDINYNEYEHLELDEVRRIIQSKGLSHEKVKLIMQGISDYRLEKAFKKEEYRRGLEWYIAGITLFAVGLLLTLLTALRIIPTYGVIFFFASLTAGMTLIKKGKNRMKTKNVSFKSKFRYNIRD